MGEINWRDSWDSALEEAKKENRRVLLELYMDGCPHCLRLHTETHADAGVVQAVNSKFIPVRLEGRSHMDVKDLIAVCRQEPVGFPHPALQVSDLRRMEAGNWTREGDGQWQGSNSRLSSENRRYCNVFVCSHRTPC